MFMKEGDLIEKREAALYRASAKLIKQRNATKHDSITTYYKGGNLVNVVEGIGNGFSRLYSNARSVDQLTPKIVKKNRKGILEPMNQLRFYPAPEGTPRGIVDEVINTYKKSKFYVMCSGGKDSISVTDFIARKYPKQFQGIIHIDTTVGIKAGRIWLEEYAEKQGWNMEVVVSDDRDVYTNLVKKFGFPSYGVHTIIMRKLKIIPLRDVWHKVKEDNSDICLMGGVRAMESIKRMANYEMPVGADHRMWFANPFFYKTKEWVLRYLFENGLEKSPINDIMGFSGECNCGSFAGKEELSKIYHVDRSLYNYFRGLEDWIANECTDPYVKKHGKYGGNIAFSREQQERMIKELGENTKFMDEVSLLEKMVCGVECGAGTMKGAGFV